MTPQSIRYKFEDSLRRVFGWLQLGKGGVNLHGNSGSRLEVWNEDSTLLARVRGAEAINSDEFITKSQLLTQVPVPTNPMAERVDINLVGGASISIPVNGVPLIVQVYRISGAGFELVNVSVKVTSNDIVIFADVSMDGFVSYIM